ncbi:MAG TPA: aminoacyl--tRNA ligase-related protein [Candidatus Saccharimonadales bacterium]|nr:aminoacyl--tRNA ligase-related protein [Candidatus Saccharimonadales bacterium]
MRLTQLFTKTSKTIPADEASKNAQLLIQAGFIHKEMAGVYAYLPLGKRVLDNVVQVIREEMNKVGGEELTMTALQSKELWEKSGRWSDDVVDNWFKSKLVTGSEVGLGFTHEEPLTNMMKQFISSYKELPVYPYQFQTKFRNEMRAKSGLMRGREFLMKDLYSFSRDKAEHDVFYEKISEAYVKVYERLGIGNITYKTFASGGTFAKFSHEFQTLSEVGEDTIYVHEGKKLAINEEVYTDEVLAELGVSKEELVEHRAVEVGNIFTLGTRFSEPLELMYTDESGRQQLVFMGSYGIGPSRLVGLLAEHFADDKGLVWPENVAPAKVYLVRIGGEEAIRHADQLYEELCAKGIEVLYDDRDVRPGEKFADSELMGIPHRVTVSDRLLETNSYEYTPRMSGSTEVLTREELLAKLN